jgi:hypothetical protein
MRNPACQCLGKVLGRAGGSGHQPLVPVPTGLRKGELASLTVRQTPMSSRERRQKSCRHRGKEYVKDGAHRHQPSTRCFPGNAPRRSRRGTSGRSGRSEFFDGAKGSEVELAAAGTFATIAACHDECAQVAAVSYPMSTIGAWGMARQFGLESTFRSHGRQPKAAYS